MPPQDPIKLVEEALDEELNVEFTPPRAREVSAVRKHIYEMANAGRDYRFKKADIIRQVRKGGISKEQAELQLKELNEKTARAIAQARENVDKAVTEVRSSLRKLYDSPAVERNAVNADAKADLRELLANSKDDAETLQRAFSSALEHNDRAMMGVLSSDWAGSLLQSRGNDPKVHDEFRKAARSQRAQATEDPHERQALELLDGPYFEKLVASGDSVARMHVEYDLTPAEIGDE